MSTQLVTSKLKAFANGVQVIAEDVPYDAVCVEIYKIPVPAGVSERSFSLSNFAIGSSGVALFAISADGYEEGGVAKLSYKMHDTGEDSRLLDCAQVLTGIGAVAQLGYMDVILLSNAGAVNRVVTIIIGRPAATP